MKKLLIYILWILTFVWVTVFAGFESWIITGTSFCISGTCVTNWSLLSKSMPYRLIVSTNSMASYTGIKQAFDYVNAHSWNAYEVLVEAGDWYIADTVTLNSSKPVVVRWASRDTTNLYTATGMSGKAMFDLRSEIEFQNLTLNASGLASYWTRAGENWVDINSPWAYTHFTNMAIMGFNKGINLYSWNIWFFDGAIDNSVAYWVYISWWDYRSALMDYFNNAKTIGLVNGSWRTFSTEHDSYTTNSWQIAIEYNPTTYTNYTNFTVFNNNFNLTNASGTVLSWADFSLSRDANIELYGNIGIEDYRPHAKLNLIWYTGSTSYTNDVWTKVVYTTLAGQYTKKRTLSTTGRATFLPSHMKSVQMRLSASVYATTAQPCDLRFAIIKNWQTGTQLGRMNVYIDQNTRPFNFSLNVYADDVKQWDYFELYVMPLTDSETIVMQNINWYMDSR